ncbi:alpha/beta hydrolase [Allofournierella sp.]|uniref:alpha/beta hydrolase n=1 Tax=Allofournierella sp. TaxID=1940256 RepID=UPI003AB6CE01
MKAKKRSVFWFCLALVLCLAGALGAGLIQSSFGAVQVTDVVLETDTGRLTGYLLVPKNATAATPAPAIVTSHGYLNTREMQDLNYVELSRRGYVVFAMNAYGHGDSSVAAEGRGSEISRATGGMTDAVEYLAALNFVDASRIGVTGHSMGGGYADATAAYYTGLERQALASGAAPEDAAAQNKVAAALIIGNVPAGLAEAGPYHAELGVIAGRYDEFFIVTLHDSVVQIFQNPITKQLAALQQGTDPVQGALVEGQRYANADTGYGITFWSPWQIHPWNHFSRITCAHTIDFFEAALGAPTPLPASNQLWWLKELFNALGLAGFFLLMVPLADLLLSTRFFGGLRAADPAPELQLTAKGRYLGTSLANSLLGGVLILPLIAVGYLLLVNPFWPQDTTAGIGLWGVGCGLVSLLLLRLGGTRFVRDSEGCGTRLSAQKLGKTLLLALAVTAGMFLTVFAADWLFQTDFRLWTFAVRTFSAGKVWVALKYLPLFLVFYLANSLAVSRSRFSGWSERRQILVSAGWNILGPVLFIALQYLPLFINGKTFFGTFLSGPLASGGALFPILVFPFVPILAIAAATGVKLYRRTGSIYLGGILNALVVTMVTVAGTSFTYPY